MIKKSLLKQTIKEGLLLVALLLTAYLFLVLFTYSNNDLSLSNQTDLRQITNIGGVVGAYIASALLELFGRSAYLLGIIVTIAWLITTFRPFDKTSEAIGTMGVAIGLAFFMLSAPALEYLRFHYDYNLPAEPGGLIGYFIANSMIVLFNPFGASLLLFGLWILSLSLAINLSWFDFFEKIGHGAEKLTTWLFCVGHCCWQVLRQKLAKFKKEDVPASPFFADESQPPQFHIFTSSIKKNQEKTTAYKKTSTITKKPVLPLLEGDNPPLPATDLLDQVQDNSVVATPYLQATARLIEESLLSFKISVSVADFHPGPVVTRYDLKPATGVKGVQIVNLARDLARSLSVGAIRVLETIPDTHYIGLEIPNKTRRHINLSDILSSSAYRDNQAKLPLALGLTATGQTAIADLASMPHLLVAGSTGSGKSVFVNAILLSLLFACTPKQLRLLLIDPKMLELSAYANIPHLLSPVVTDMNQAPLALNWAVAEMERRYQLMAKTGVRHISAYNQFISKKTPTDEEDNSDLTPLPYIVIIIDELADLMVIAGKKVEISISRLAQKARASGIHLILATQRPSVDVITGLIKANIPCRLSFQIASRVDSRTILDQMGAESLLGKGDMLYLPTGAGIPQRLHGAFVSDEEVKRVVDYIHAHYGGTHYLTDFTDLNTNGDNSSDSSEEGIDTVDALYEQAVESTLSSNRVSVSLIQRKFRIGYNRAARIVEQMEKQGIVSAMNENGSRQVLSNS